MFGHRQQVGPHETAQTGLIQRFASNCLFGRFEHPIGEAFGQGVSQFGSTTDPVVHNRLGYPGLNRNRFK